MGNVLVVVEQRGGAVRAVAGQIVSGAASLAGRLGVDLHALLVGPPGIEEEAGTLGRFGAVLVRVVCHEALSSYHPEGTPEAVARAVEGGGYLAVLLAATDQGKDLAPRLAARLDVPLAQDVTGLSVEEGGIRVERPVYAGKAVTRIRVEASPLIATLRPNVFPVETGGAAADVEMLDLSLEPADWLTEVISFEAVQEDIPDVAEASIVVSGGRGMKDPGNWGILEDLREALGGEAGLGASRAVVDAGWRPHAEQVGQTGKTVAPKLYFAIGVSGAVQHLAGMRTSGVVVAVNRDPDAPIFRIADYGIVGDLFEVVPRLTEELRALGEPA